MDLGQVAGDLPVWAVAVLIVLTITAAKMIYGIFTRRLCIIETTLKELSQNQRDFVTSQEHTRDMREMREEMQRRFESVESKISQSNLRLEDRVDDIHVLITTLIPELSKHRD